MKNFIKDKKHYIFVLILIGILTFVFPFSHDDWLFGSEGGKELLNSFFKDYNGRYGTNLLCILLTSSNLLKTIFMTAVIFIIIWCFSKIVNPKNRNIYYLSILLLLLIPRNIFRQGIVWTSSFVNYMTPAMLMLVYFYINRNIFNEFKDNRNFKLIFILLLGFISGMFVENMTIFNVLISLSLVIYSFIKYKKLSFNNLTFLIGAITAAVVMFSNGAYTNITNGVDWYRNIPLDFAGIITRLEINLPAIIDNIVFNNIMVILIFNLLLVKASLSSKLVNFKAGLLKLMMFIILAFSSYIVIKHFNSQWQFALGYTELFEYMIIGIYIISALGIIILTSKDKNQLHKMLFYIISFGLILAPLFLVYPIGPRCFINTNIVLIILILELFNHFYDEIKGSSLKSPLIIFSLAFYMFYLSIYGYIYKINIEVVDYLKSVENFDIEIEIPYIPYGNEYVHGINPNSVDWANHYKKFYKINDDAKFKFVSYKRWHKKYK